jgi:hypothetical protein
MSVELGPNDSSVEVGPTGTTPTTHKVEPGKSADIPVPDVPPGTILLVRIGRGSHARFHLVEVVATFR